MLARPRSGATSPGPTSPASQPTTASSTTVTATAGPRRPRAKIATVSPTRTTAATSQPDSATGSRNTDATSPRTKFPNPGGTIASGALPLAVLVALAAGFVSFASPCVLPLVPGFLGYVTGLGDATLEQRRRSRLVLGALLFVLGFTLVFLALFIAASAVGYLLADHLDLLTRVGGALVIILALIFLGLGSRWGSQRTVSLRWRAPAGRAVARSAGAAMAVAMLALLLQG